MLWKKRRADSHLFGPTAQRELGTRAAAGPDRGAHAHGSFAEMYPHYYIIGLHCLALFLETQLLYVVFGTSYLCNGVALDVPVHDEAVSAGMA